MEPKVRLSRPTDMTVLCGLDLKCYDYPLDMTEWQALINGSGDDEKARVAVVELLRNPVGFAVWQKLDDDVIEIKRLGVLASHRRHGLGRALVLDIEKDARRRACDILRVVVPEIHCQHGVKDEDDVTVFLNKMAFRPTGKIVNNFAVMYGDSVDGYVWERKVL